MEKNLRTSTRVILLTAAYFLGGLLGKSAAFMNGDLALVWPPAGIALAAILLFVGLKMVLYRWVHLPTGTSLAVIAAILVVAIAASWLRPAPPG